MRNLNGWISFLSLILLAFMVSGCSSDSDEEQNMSIVMPDSNQKNQSFNSDDVSGSFSFVATAHWTASIVETSVANRSVNTSPNWISLDKYSGEAGEYTLTITLTPNNTGKTRTATITVSSGSEEITVTVTQKSAAESGDDTDSEEYDWVEYDELYIKDDGEDHCLSTKGHYLYFKILVSFKEVKVVKVKECICSIVEKSHGKISVLWNNLNGIKKHGRAN